jgi:hypothetical protein
MTTRNVARLFGRSATRKIPVYPFVYFIGVARPGQLQRAIQISNKISKRSVQRHILKRTRYAQIIKILQENPTIIPSWYYVLAVPQQNRITATTQLLATTDKTAILKKLRSEYATSLSTLAKKLWSSVDWKKPLPPYKNVEKN